MRSPTARNPSEAGAPNVSHFPHRSPQPPTSSFRRRPESHFAVEDGGFPGRRRVLSYKASAIPAFAGMTTGEADGFLVGAGRRLATRTETEGRRA